jgi:AraC-like DNA-binding protein
MMSLAQLLDGLDVSVESLVVDDVRSGSAMALGRIEAATVQYSIDGTGVLALAGGAIVNCSAQRVIVLPALDRARLIPATGAGKAGLLVAHGRIRVTYHGSVGLFDALREPLVHVLTPEDTVRLAFEDLLEEILRQRPGARAMAEALLRRWVILLLRRSWLDAAHPPCWLAILEDERLCRALTAMLDRPEQAFTVAGLAEVAGMSRSVFAARFGAAVGRSPMEFLKTLRLERAAHLLTGTDLPVKSITTRVGYSSRSSFTRAFVTSRGIDPTAFRSTARVSPPASAASPSLPSAIGRSATTSGRRDARADRYSRLRHGIASAHDPERRRHLSA